MKKKKWIKWVVIALIVVVLFVAYTRVSSRVQSAAGANDETVEMGSLTTYYNFDGLIYAPRVQTITAGTADSVDRVYVTQNQQVKDGDRLYSTEKGGVVRADIDGELTGLFISEGDVLTVGQKTAEIIDMSRLEARINVDEYDVNVVTPGTEVEVTVLAMDAAYSVTVSALNKNGTASGDLSYYTVTVPLPDLQDAYPGMQVSAQVLSGHVDGAILVRTDALHFNGYNEPYVIVRNADGSTSDVPVEVGLNDGVYCEVISGLSVGDKVLVEDDFSITDMMQQMRQRRQSMQN